MIYSDGIAEPTHQPQREIDEKTGKSIQLVLVRASEAHILAKEIAEAGVGVILIPPRMYPGTWDSKRVLPGPPLTAQSAVGVLSSHNIKLGVGVVEEWEPRNQRLDIGWVSSVIDLCIVFNS